MPNWCQNNLEVSGTREGIQLFRDQATFGSELFALRALLPLPEVTWEMAQNHWGVTQDVRDVQLGSDPEVDDDFIVYNFESAWGAPDVALMRIAQRFPNLKFQLQYYESGNEFAGRMYFEGGKPTVITNLNAERDGEAYQKLLYEDDWEIPTDDE